MCGVHRNTVRQWLKNGLHAIDTRHPTVILGTTLADYLRLRRTRNKRPCQPGEMYCMRCREPKLPADLRAEYRTLTETQGNLIGLCSVCKSRMFRRVSLAKLSLVCGTLRVTPPQAQGHIDESPTPTVNSDFCQRRSGSALFRRRLVAS